MGNNTLLAGTALMLLLLVPVWLSPQESLHPSRRTGPTGHRWRA